MIAFASVLAGLVGVHLVLLRPGLLLPMLLVISSVYDVAIRAGPVAVHPSNILLLAFTAGILLLRARQGALQLGRIQVLSAVIGAWVVFCGLARLGPGTMRRLLALALMYVAFEGAYQALRTRTDLAHFREWVAVAGALATLRAWSNRSPAFFNGRAFGVFGNPNALGMFLAGTLPLTFSLLLSSAPRWQRRLATLGFAISAYGLWISGSRGALIGAFAGCVLVASRHLRQTLAAGALLGIVLAGVTAVEESGHGLHRIPNAFRVAPIAFETSKVWLSFGGFEEASFTEPPWMIPGTLNDFPQSFGARMMVWYQGLRTAWANPILGVGTGNSRFAAIPFDSKVFNNCFNIYLSPLVEGGLPGFLLHLLWLRMLIVAGLRLVRRSHPDRLGLGYTGSALAFLCHGAVEDSYFAIYANWMIGLVFGALMATAELADHPGDATENDR